MRFEPEASDGANAGLHIIHDLLIPVKEAFPNVSTADIWAMSGAVAVEFAGGPAVPFKICRKDAVQNVQSDQSDVQSAVPENGRLPDASQGAQHLRDVFYRMGFNDREIVALSGGHTLGRCHKMRSGYDGAWTHDPLAFNNSYFVNLMTMTWKKREWDGPEQYTDEETLRLIMLPTDIALKEDSVFKPVAQEYADNESVFRDDFAAAYGKLLALGCKPGEPKAPAAPGCPFMAKATNSADFRDMAMHGSIEHCKESVAKGADVHALEKNSGRSALHKAAFWNHVHMMDWMIGELKMEVNLQDYNGDTPLHDAARFGHADIVSALLKGGARVDVINKEGKTAEGVARDYEKAKTADFIKK